MTRSWSAWRDAFFWIGLVLYAANKGWGLVEARAPSMRGHFNDLLLIPVALPVLLQAQAWLGLRPKGEPPRWRETILHLAVWSVICEWLGPLWLHRGTADAWDVACYSAGAIAAQCWWNAWE